MRVLVVGFIVVVVIGWFVLDALGSSRALARISGQPVVELVRGTDAVPVWQGTTPTVPPPPGEAGLLRYSAIPLGYRADFLLPDGTILPCRERALAEMRCRDGWVPVRAPSDRSGGAPSPSP